MGNLKYQYSDELKYLRKNVLPLVNEEGEKYIMSIIKHLEEINKFQKDYIEFLKCGKSKNPLDSLKVCGVDLSDKSVISSAIDMFNDTINEFNDLYFE